MNLGLKPLNTVPVDEQEDLGLKPLNSTPAVEQDDLGLKPLRLAGTEPEAAPQEGGGFLDAAWRGIKTSLDPFNVETKDIQVQRQGAEKVVETAANIGTDILSTVAVSAGVGALAGSVVPGAGTVAGTVAGIGLGLYRALGYEDMMSRGKGEEFNLGRAAVNAATEINPALRLGGRLAKFASQGALQAAQALAYGGDAEDAVLAGALGGVLGAAGHRSMKPGELKATGITALIATPEMGAKGTQDLLDAITEEGTRRTLAQGAVDRLIAAEAAAAPKMDAVLSSETLFADLAKGAKDLTGELGSLTKKDLQSFGVTSVRMKEAKGVVEANMQVSGEQLTIRQVAEAARKLAVGDLLEEHATDLARLVARDSKLKGKELFEKAAQELKATGMSMPDFVQQSRLKKAYMDEVEDAAERMTTTAKVADPMRNSALRWLSDVKFFARTSDRVTELALDPAFNNVSIAKYKKNAFVFKIGKQTEGLIKAAKKEGIDHAKISSMLDVDPASLNLTPKQTEVLSGFRALFNEVRDVSKKHNLDIAYHENYIPHFQKDADELIRVTKQQAKAYLRPNNKFNHDLFRDEGLLHMLQKLSGVDIKKDADVFTALRRIDDPENVSRVNIAATSRRKGTPSDVAAPTGGFKASAAFERDGKLPEWAREQDIGKLLLRYANNLGNAIFMDPAIRNIEIMIPAYRTLGHVHTAAALEHRVARLSGVQSDFMQWTSNAVTRYKVSINNIIDEQELTGIKKMGFEAAKFVPDLVSWSIGQIYPNFLGFSPGAVLRNFSQVPILTSGEIGAGYGHTLAGQAAVRMAQDKAKGINFQAELVKRGWHPGEYTGEGVDLVNDGVRRTLVGPYIRAAEAVGQTAMYFYSKSDAVNRYWTMLMGQQIAKEATSGGASARKFLKAMPEGARANVYRALKRGEAIDAPIIEHLLSTTQFDYGPQALHAFGMEYGRLVSMFTKWPAMVIGDGLDMWARRDIKKAFGKYVAPFMALAAVDEWMDGTKDNPRLRALVGKRMLDWHPAAAINIQAPPALTIAGDAGSTLLNMLKLDFAAAGKSAMKAATPVTPFMSIPLGAVNKIYYNTLLNEEGIK